MEFLVIAVIPVPVVRRVKKKGGMHVSKCVCFTGRVLLVVTVEVAAAAAVLAPAPILPVVHAHVHQGSVLAA